MVTSITGYDTIVTYKTSTRNDRNFIVHFQQLITKALEVGNSAVDLTMTPEKILKYLHLKKENFPHIFQFFSNLMTI